MMYAKQMASWSAMEWSVGLACGLLVVVLAVAMATELVRGSRRK